MERETTAAGRRMWLLAPPSSRGFVLIVLAACLAVSTLVETANAHQTVNGVWTYRYFTRDDSGSAQSNCQNNAGLIDPLNIITYQWGEWARMHTHLANETDWEPTWFGSGQVTCITTDGANYSTHGQDEQQGGHGTSTRAHFRIFAAGHNHDDVQYKWGVLDVHHEGCCAHDPDEDWENWETHLGGEIGVAHNIYWDEYVRQGAMYWRGFYDSGAVTRVGGLHYGAYP